MAKKPWASKTFWFFILYAVVNISGLVGFADFTPTEDQSELVGLLVAGAGMLLRFLTNKGISFGA